MEFRQLQFVLEKTYPSTVSLEEYEIILELLEFLSTHTHGEFNILVNTTVNGRTRDSSRHVIIQKIEKKKKELDVLSS